MGMPPTIEYATLGMWDSLILMIMGLVVFGPRRLPQIGRQIGKLMYEFRKASNDFKYQMEEELRTAEEADRRKKEEERLQALARSAPALTLEAAKSEPSPAATEPAETASPYPNEDFYPPQEAGDQQAPADRPWNLEEELAKTSAATLPADPAPASVAEEDYNIPAEFRPSVNPLAAEGTEHHG
jgi:sec-independent protein translocase protein TatB